MSPIIQAKYTELAQTSLMFQQLAEKVRSIYDDLTVNTDALEGEWIGYGAENFFSEMNDDILPAILRLEGAFLKTDQVINQISERFLETEANAALQIKNNSLLPTSHLVLAASDMTLMNTYQDLGIRPYLENSTYNQTLCHASIQEVQGIIDEVIRLRNNAPAYVRLIPESQMVLDILAKYYSGIPFNTWGMYTGPIPRNSQFQQGDSDKWPINTNMPWGSVEFEWDHPINHYEGRPEGYTNPNLDIGRALRGDYGFKRPFFEQSHPVSYTHLTLPTKA